ncbi:hypothetical protein GGQ84_000752 [Desulfitispora alkaliphila]|uniref:hypothetical protein n=1 Tax=Desulfitispora alkaliphila TaxID=622674 RepID=UPI003D1B03A0
MKQLLFQYGEAKFYVVRKDPMNNEYIYAFNTGNKTVEFDIRVLPVPDWLDKKDHELIIINGICSGCFRDINPICYIWPYDYMKLPKFWLSLLIRMYDYYIQKANEESKYLEGWVPESFEDFYLKKFQDYINRRLYQQDSII